MEKINDYFTNGIIVQAFQAERNIAIWKAIGNKVEILKTQTKEVKKLYSFIQISAQTNFILYTAKLFDNPDKNYPTRCILSFLELIKNNSNSLPQIIEVPNTIKLLKEYDCPAELIQAVNTNDITIFPLEFYQYYYKKYNSDVIQGKIKEVKYIRNKFIAHNENILNSQNLELKIVEDLLNFALEIIAIFGIAYDSTLYSFNGKSILTENVNHDIYFILQELNKLPTNN